MLESNSKLSQLQMLEQWKQWQTWKERGCKWLTSVPISFYSSIHSNQLSRNLFEFMNFDGCQTWRQNMFLLPNSLHQCQNHIFVRTASTISWICLLLEKKTWQKNENNGCSEVKQFFLDMEMENWQHDTVLAQNPDQVDQTNRFPNHPISP